MGGRRRCGSGAGAGGTCASREPSTRRKQGLLREKRVLQRRPLNFVKQFYMHQQSPHGRRFQLLKGVAMELRDTVMLVFTVLGFILEVVKYIHELRKERRNKEKR
jgi:hypothetical protein